MKRFRVPVKPIVFENFESKVELYGNPLPINRTLIGVSIIYDEINDRILLYGGSVITNKVLKN